jgi:hypothetical protein
MRETTYVAEVRCERCGGKSLTALPSQDPHQTVPCNTCGGERRPVRIFGDRRVREVPVAHERRRAIPTHF